MNFKIISKTDFIIVAYLVAFILGYLLVWLWFSLTHDCGVNFGCGFESLVIPVIGGMFGVILVLIDRIVRHILKRK